MVVKTSSAPQPTVALYVITTGYTPFLEQTLKAVKEGSYQPKSITVVDTSDSDSKHRVVAHHLLPFKPLRLVNAPSKTIGEALGAARFRVPEMVDYLWVLHDDSAPACTTLERLVYQCEDDDRVAVAGPKVFSWNNPEQLLSVGIEASRGAVRLPKLDSYEIDQGQYDRRNEVLAVGSAGMLIRAKVFDQLRGFNRYLGPYGEGLEFCRRVWLAGYRVSVVPLAHLYHAQASYNGYRNQVNHFFSEQPIPSEDVIETQNRELAKESVQPLYPTTTIRLHSPLPHHLAPFDYCGFDPNDPNGPRPHQSVREYDPVPVLPVLPEEFCRPQLSEPERIKAHYFLRAIYVPRGMIFPWMLLQLLLNLVVGFGKILLRQSELAGYRIAAIVNLFKHYSWVRKSRRQAFSSKKRPLSTLSRYEVKPREIRHQQRIINRIEKDRARPELILEQAAQIQLDNLKWRLRVSFAFLCLFGLIVSAAMSFPYWRGLHGGYWGGLPDSWWDLAQAVNTHWIPGGMGRTGVSDPVVWIFTALSMPLGMLGVSPNWFLKLVFFTSPLLALCSAWFAAATLSRHPAVRSLMALSWLAFPAFVLSFYSGNIAALLGLIALPIALSALLQFYGIRSSYLLRGVRKVVTYQPSIGVRAAPGLAALAIMVVSATAPWMICVFFVLVMALSASYMWAHWKSSNRTIWRCAGGLLLLLPSVVLLLPGFTDALQAPNDGFLKAFLWQTPSTDYHFSYLSLNHTLFNTWYGWLIGVATLLVIIGVLVALFVPRLITTNILTVLLIGLALLALRWGIQTPVGNASGQVSYAWPALAVGLIWLLLLTFLANMANTLGFSTVYPKYWPALRSLFSVMSVLLLGSSLVSIAIVPSNISSVTGFRAGKEVSPSGFDVISQGPERARLLMITRTAQASYLVKLLRLPGASLLQSNTSIRVEKTESRHWDRFDRSQANLVAQLLSGNGEAASRIALSLGADEIILQHDADPKGKIFNTLRSASRSSLVDKQNEYSIWRIDYKGLEDIYSPVRVGWTQGNTKRSVPSGILNVGTKVSVSAQNRLIVLHERFNTNWKAVINNKPLKPVEIEGQQGFAWPAGQAGYLRISYDDGYWFIWGYVMWVVVAICVIAAIPLRQKKRCAR